MKKITSNIAIITMFAPATQSSFAHHPLDGQPMQTLYQGLVSGVAHPVLGLDHLLFIMVAGVLAAINRNTLLAPLLAISGATLGVCLSLLTSGFVWTDIAVAATLIIVGILLFNKKVLLPSHCAMLFLILGVFHGLAYGITLVEQKSVLPLVLTGYIAGLAIIQWLIAVSAGTLFMRLAARSKQINYFQAFGAVAAVTGAAFMINGA